MMNALTTAELIHSLDLEKHIEGGYFKRTFEANHRKKIDTEDGARFTMTSIFYLLTRQACIGQWHLNRSDIQHFYQLGEAITYHLIHQNGSYEKVIMGPDPRLGHQLQLTVKGGTWKASHLEAGDHGLVSEAVSPGFEFDDMTLGNEAALIKAFPQHEAIISAIFDSAQTSGD